MKFYSIIKGLAFVFTTGCLLFYWVNQELKEKNAIIKHLNTEVELREELIRELHHRVKNNLQVILGLVNISTRDLSEYEDIRIKITNKLHALMAIVNTVYDFKDFNNIALNTVLEEYKAVSLWDLEIQVKDNDPKLCIEQMTSLLLLINTILEFLYDKHAIVHVLLIIESNKIIIQCDEINEKSMQELRSDDVVIALLDSIKGELVLSGDSVSIILKVQMTSSH